MARPDLSVAQGRAAYARELGAVARPWRWGGLAAVTAGAAVILWFRFSSGFTWDSAPGWTAIALEAVGWSLVAVAIVRRTRHHRRRMAEPAA